ncbi:peptidase S8, partial [Streptomyces sp. NPDC051132]
MAHLRSSRRLALAVPAVLSLTATLGFLPSAASAAAPAGPAVPAARAADGPTLSYVVNTRKDHRTIESVRRAITRAGGTV